MPLSEDNHHLLVFIKVLMAYIACTIVVAVCKKVVAVAALRIAWASIALAAMNVALHLMLGMTALVMLGIPTASRMQYRVMGFLIGAGSMLTGVSVVLVELHVLSSALSALAWLSWASLALMCSGFVFLVLSVYDALRRKLQWLSALLLVLVASWALTGVLGLQGMPLLAEIFRVPALGVSADSVVCSIIGLVGWAAILDTMKRC